MPMTTTEAHRLAASIHALRPDWPLASLSTFIRGKLADRPYRDAAVALAWIATDTQTTTPARVLEAGPWWRAVMADGGTVSTVTTRCPEHPANAAWKCADCDTATLPADRAAELGLWQRPRLTRPARTRTTPQPTFTQGDLDALRRAMDAAAEETS